MLASRFLQNVGWQALSIGSLIASELAITLLLSAQLGADGFGLYAFAYAYCFIAYQLCDLRLTDTLIAFFPEYKKRGMTEANALLAGAFLLDAARGTAGFLLISISVWFLAPLLWTHGDIHLEILLMGVFLLFNNLVMAASRGYFRSLDRFISQAITQAATGLIKLGAVILAFLPGTGDILWYFSILALAGVISLLVQLTLLGQCFTHDGFKLRAGFKNFHLIEKQPVIRFFKHIYIGGLSSIITKELDVIILSLFTGASSIGIYRLAKSFFSGVGSLWDAVFFVLFPEISKLSASGNKAALDKLIKRNMVWGLLAAIMVIIFGFLAVKLVIAYFYQGKGFASVPEIFAILSLGFVIWVPLLWLNPLLLSRKQAHLTAIGAWIGAIFTAIGFLVFIPSLGIWGAAMVIATSSAAGLLPILYLARKKGIVPV